MQTGLPGLQSCGRGNVNHLAGKCASPLCTPPRALPRLHAPFYSLSTNNQALLGNSKKHASRILDTPPTRIHLLQHASVQHPEPMPVDKKHPSTSVPRLLTKLQAAHGASITALFCLTDKYDEKLVVSSSLDKSLCTWRVTNCKQPPPPGTTRGPDAPPLPPLLDANGNPKLEVQVVRLKAPRAPVFSIVRQPSPAVGSVFSPTAEVLFCGNAAKEMFAWEVKPCPFDDPCPANFQMVATEYSGWVRSLAIMGKWLISCGCNCLRQHDTSFPLPKEVSNIEQAFKGDILTIAAGQNKVYAGCTDGCLRSWSLNSKSGALSLGKEVVGAHSSRITGLTIHGPHLYSVSLDGCIRVWRTQDLVCVAQVKAAHDGKKIHAVAFGPDDILYTGGDDKLVRRWKPLTSHPALIVDSQPAAPPSPVTPSTSVNATTGEVTSTLPSDSDSDGLDSHDCDLGGSLPASREATPSAGGTPSGDGLSAAANQEPSTASAALQPSSSAGSSRNGGGMERGTGNTQEAGTLRASAASLGGAAEGGRLNQRLGSEAMNSSTNGTGVEEHAGNEVLQLQVAPGGPLAAHESGLRCIAAGSNQVLVSGDANGDLCIWATNPSSPVAKPS
ncbi:WD40-repeat-containing domain protein [Dunaliella salina]|uniref:WD40-repeat-containing domain protein n=1 Tax=Dunaliella salina TaxID=3046 RepID=A0ABQ7GP23_DUNSA|nr:WD40-repeat-containing domain protein [Dunaliella salina]|eukprot:KAF5836356.1 WD40-repeat-containing domain protein [Dunaliella salina]